MAPTPEITAEPLPPHWPDVFTNWEYSPIDEEAQGKLLNEMAQHFDGRPDAVIPAIRTAQRAYDIRVCGYLTLALVRALPRIDPSGDVLLTLVRNEGQVDQWYVQQAAVKALAESQHPDLIPLLRSLVRAGRVDYKVREAALLTLAQHRDEGASLEALQGWHALGPEAFVHDEALLAARGLLGDLTVTRDLIVARWSHRPDVRELAMQGLPSLEAGGLLPLVRALGGTGDDLMAQLRHLSWADPSPEVRCWALLHLVQQQPEQAADTYLQALSDPGWLVTRTASDSLASFRPAPLEALRERMDNPTLSLSERLWAARTLLMLGERPDLAGLPEVRIELPPSIPPEVRAACVRHWARWVSQGTDVRWLIEALTLAPWDQAEVQVLQDEHRQVVAALHDRGLPAQQPVTARAWYGEPDGWSGFSVVDVDDAAVALSHVGRAATLLSWRRDQPLELLDDPTVEAIRAAVAAAGWTWLGPEVLELYVPGLRIRGYYDDGPGRLADLLFYRPG